MRIAFTKMQGAGNDFVVLDGIGQRFDADALTPARLRALADRRFGVGADQILLVEPARRTDTDFRYRIFNADGGEVEQCGNGARCFVKFVRDRGLTSARTIRIETAGGVIEPRVGDDGEISVDMGAVAFAPTRVPFDDAGLVPARLGDGVTWSLTRADAALAFGVASMGNPHAVVRVDDVDAARVAADGAWLERHPRFAQRVNVGFMQIIERGAIALRVWERGVGETLACGTGACAAVALGIRWGLLDPRVIVHARGGRLRVDWAGGTAPVFLSGPAVEVFRGEIDL